MTQGDILAVFHDAMFVALELSAPLLVVSIMVGLVVAIFQAATQIHEQTLTFVPKVLAIAFLLLALGSWMIMVINDFVNRLFAQML